MPDGSDLMGAMVTENLAGCKESRAKSGPNKLRHAFYAAAHQVTAIANNNASCFGEKRCLS